MITMIVADESIVFKRFTEFTHKFNKVYASVEEFQSRFEIFKSNLLEVLAVDTFSGPHTKGVTKFFDLTKDEFRAQYLNLKVKQGWCQPSQLKFLSEVSAIPAELDWRAKGAVSPVKDQGQCGSCWAFSTVGYLESQWLIKNKSSQTFSEQQLVDCDNVDAGCNGGLMQAAFEYVQTNGIEADTKYPYTARGQTCKFNKASVVSTVSDVQCFEDNTDEQVKQYLNSIGPLAIALDATDFQYYDSGVLKCEGSQLDHGVLLVGYGSEDGEDFWIVKNSWGKNWGESGFVRISTKAGENCAVGIYVAAATLA
jgi:C1A family cysteine protease